MTESEGSGEYIHDTPEKLEAVRRLDAAISNYQRVFGDHRMVTDWVVLTASSSPDSEGTRYAWLVPELRPSWHHLLGLVRACTLLLEGHYQDD